ncbi:hypothetical protein Ccrd_018117 [Cynara cardunculus var. scolymus]|uniref:Uncharacterized protein n=1 Tax=Cynara cardunculus var. scolymus TaxID=59895 RepID=A0A124SFL1_CYNCS|nr:hypothetical protein Ccrd_018117 [Cynara cardunculus var. scolymus]
MTSAVPVKGTTSGGGGGSGSRWCPTPEQGGGVEDASNCKGMMDNWKVDLPSNQTCKFMCDCPLMSMMMMDNHGTTPYCTRVPPKTLQLFPVTTTDLKDDDDHHQFTITTKP